jgi:DNA (cytosine-5)-methyltransferase 1
MRTQIANPRGFETLVVPPGFIAELRRNGGARSLTEPMATICAGGNHHALVIPYYSTGVPKSVLAPFDTLTTRDRFALVDPAVEIDDCYLRMVQPAEQLASQAFPDWYTVVGNKGQQTAQAGNAVSVNVARWIAERIYAVLDSRDAA